MTARPQLAPHEPGLELAVLGGCVKDGAFAARAVRELASSDFFKDTHRALFSAIIEAVAEGGSLDPAGLSHAAAEAGVEIPATVFLDAEEACPSPTAAIPYIAKIKSLARARTILDASQRLTEHVSRNGSEPDEHLADFLEIVGTPQVVADTPPIISRVADDFTFAWPALGVEMRLERLRDDTGGVHGEITVNHRGACVHWSRLVLASLSAREGLVTKLHRTHGRVPWRTLLEIACRETTTQFRQGSPTVELVPRIAAEETRRLVDKVILDGDINVLFGDGGVGKSLTADVLGVSVRTGTVLPSGLVPRRTGPVLYLDWETTRDEHEDRLARLLGGLGIRGPAPIAYRQMVGALADEAVTVRQEVARLGAILVIVDSLAPACGSEPETADANIRAFAALRSFGCASLVLAHVSKAMVDAPRGARPFGSVFVSNLARNVWELRRAENASDEDVLTVGMYHTKTNRGRLLPPFGLQFSFIGTRTHLEAVEITGDVGLRERAGLGYSIKAALRSGGRTIAELAEEVEASEENIKKALYRLEKSGVVIRLGDGKHGPGKPVQWGLASRTRDVLPTKESVQK